MPNFTFPSTVPGQGPIIIKAPDRATAVHRYNAMMQPANDQVMVDQNIDWAPNGQVIDYQPPPEPGPQDPGPQSFDDGSGSGAASGPPPPPYDVNADPAYQAFLASLGPTEEAARRNAANRISEVDQQLNSRLPRLAEQGIESRRKIGEGYATRGVFRSGARLRDIALEQRAENYAATDAATAAARQKAQLGDALSAQIAQLARDRAEKALDLTAAHAY